MKNRSRCIYLLIAAVCIFLGSCAGRIPPRAGEGDAFYFVQITDTHFGARGYLENIEKRLPGSTIYPRTSPSLYTPGIS